MEAVVNPQLNVATAIFNTIVEDQGANVWGEEEKLGRKSTDVVGKPGGVALRAWELHDRGCPPHQFRKRFICAGFGDWIEKLCESENRSSISVRDDRMDRLR